MDIEYALCILEGCLIEPILNFKHTDKNKRRVIEVQSGSYDARVCAYGETFTEALISAATQHKEMTI